MEPRNRATSWFIYFPRLQPRTKALRLALEEFLIVTSGSVDRISRLGAFARVATGLSLSSLARLSRLTVPSSSGNDNPRFHCSPGNVEKSGVLRPAGRRGGGWLSWQAGRASGCDMHLGPGAIRARRDSPCSPYSAAFSSLNSRDATHSAEGLSGRRSNGEQWKPRATLGVDHPIHPAEQFVVLNFSALPDTYRRGVNAALWENAPRRYGSS